MTSQLLILMFAESCGVFFSLKAQIEMSDPVPTPATINNTSHKGTEDFKSFIKMVNG